MERESGWTDGERPQKWPPQKHPSERESARGEYNIVRIRALHLQLLQTTN